MSLNDFFTKTSKGLSDGGKLVVDGSGSGTGGVEIHEVFASGGIELYKEVDTNDDGTYDLSVLIESQNDAFHSQENQIEISEGENVQITLVNIDGSTIDCGVNGIEVSD